MLVDVIRHQHECVRNAVALLASLDGAAHDRLAAAFDDEISREPSRLHRPRAADARLEPMLGAEVREQRERRRDLRDRCRMHGDVRRLRHEDRAVGADGVDILPVPDGPCERLQRRLRVGNGGVQHDAEQREHRP